MKAIIVDDESKSYNKLRKLIVQHHPGIEIIGRGENVQHAYQVILELQPELVFLDVEMPDGTGFDLLKMISKRDFYVIFVTAFNKYAISAIRFGAIDYLLKPVDKVELAASIREVNRNKDQKINQEQFHILWEAIQGQNSRKIPTRIAISTTEGIHFEQISDVIRLEAQQNYTEFKLANAKKRILASINIGAYEQQFELYDEFMRIHRSHLINLRYVDRYVKADGGYVVMKDGLEISVSRLYKDQVLNKLSQL